MSARRVAVTGLGAVTPLGLGVAATWAAALAGRSGVRRLDAPPAARLAAPMAVAAVPGFDGAAHFDAPKLRMLDRVSQFALVAAAEAAADAGAGWAGADRWRAGVFVGTGMGASHTLDDGYRTLYGEGSDRIRPFTVLMGMHNAPASWLGIEHGLNGPNLTYSTACSSSAVAIGEAWRRVRDGDCDAALAGGAEAPLSPGSLKAWEALHTLAAVDAADPSASCKPFSKDRSGMVLGEGAAMLVLEAWDRAVARGAAIHGEVVGYGLVTDTAHITRPSVEGQAAALRAALASASLEPSRGRRHQRPRHRHAGQRRRRDGRRARGVRRARAAHPAQLDEGDARPPARRRRRDRVPAVAARHARGRRAADAAPAPRRPGVRPRPRARGRAARRGGAHDAFQLVRVRGDERGAGAARGGLTTPGRSRVACTPHALPQDYSRSRLTSGGGPVLRRTSIHFARVTPMVEFVRRRLQVFVSSTYTDLRAERQAAVEAILVAGHIPAGMELFTAGDESQMEAIRQWIEESDVYMLILGGRYGSIEPTSGKSYTRLEYEYAMKLGKPLFACVVTEQAKERRIRDMGSSAIEATNPSGLNEFRELVLSRLVRFWDDAKDIKVAVHETLAHFARREDLVGWVRPPVSAADIGPLADEIARLSRENASLRKHLAAQEGPLIAGFRFDELQDLLVRKGIMNFLWSQKASFGSESGFGLKNPEFPEERDEFQSLKSRLRGLEQLGLIEKEPDIFYYGKYRLTADGRMFLNRLELLELREKTDAPAIRVGYLFLPSRPMEKNLWTGANVSPQTRKSYSASRRYEARAFRWS